MENALDKLVSIRSSLFCLRNIIASIEQQKDNTSLILMQAQEETFATEIRDLVLSLLRPGTCWVLEDLGGRVAMCREANIVLVGIGYSGYYESGTIQLEDFIREDPRPLLHEAGSMTYINLRRLSSFAFSEDPVYQEVAAYISRFRIGSVGFSQTLNSPMSDVNCLVDSIVVSFAKTVPTERWIYVGALEAVAKASADRCAVVGALTRDPGLAEGSELLTTLLKEDVTGSYLIETHHVL